VPDPPRVNPLQEERKSVSQEVQVFGSRQAVSVSIPPFALMLDLTPLRSHSLAVWEAVALFAPASISC
jgi:hypothetical protein